jgi:hypothetical protein
MNNVVYQLIGFGALITLGLSYWQKDKKKIMLWQMAANLVFAIHYFLLSARSGAWSSLFQIIVLIFFALRDKKRWNAIAVGIPVVIAFVFIGIVTYENPFSVLPILASIIALLPFCQSNNMVIRIAGVLSALTWLVYAIVVHSYSGIVTEIVLTVITFSSLWKKPNPGTINNRA